MSPHAYTEDQFVEQPAIGLFAEYAAMPHTQPFSHTSHPQPRLSQRKRNWTVCRTGAKNRLGWVLFEFTTENFCKYHIYNYLLFQQKAER